MVVASASGNTVPAIARLVSTSEDRVREMIHRFNDKGMLSLDPQWAGGRPRRITGASPISCAQDLGGCADWWQTAAEAPTSVSSLIGVCGSLG